MASKACYPIRRAPYRLTLALGQADQLLAKSSASIMLDPVQDAVRDFRVAEREGRRMRRRQVKMQPFVQLSISILTHTHTHTTQYLSTQHAKRISSQLFKQIFIYLCFVIQHRCSF